MSIYERLIEPTCPNCGEFSWPAALRDESGSHNEIIEFVQTLVAVYRDGTDILDWLVTTSDWLRSLRHSG